MTSFFKHVNPQDVAADIRAELKDEPGFLSTCVGFSKVMGLPVIYVHYKHTLSDDGVMHLKQKLAGSSVDIGPFEIEFVPQGPVRPDTV